LSITHRPRQANFHNHIKETDPMTILTDDTLVGQEADLLGRLKAMLNAHPAGCAFQLLLAPAGVTVADDEILVQEIDTDRGVVELRPRRISDVALGDVLHATQLISPTDEDFTRYAGEPQATVYYPIKRNDGSTGHLMGTAS
jgi:hypothetical protein